MVDNRGNIINKGKWCIIEGNNKVHTYDVFSEQSIPLKDHLYLGYGNNCNLLGGELINKSDRLEGHFYKKIDLNKNNLKPEYIKNKVDIEIANMILSLIKNEYVDNFIIKNFKNIIEMFNIRISLDFDDVMYNLMLLNIKYIEKKFGVKDIHLQIKDYYWLYKTYPEIANDLWNHPENYITGDLVDGAKEFYKYLVSIFTESRIQIVTSSMENIIEEKNKMIRERFNFNCTVHHAIFNKYKKHDFTIGTILIDDHIGNIIDHLEFNNGYGIVFNHMKLDYIIEKQNQLDGMYEKIKYSEDFDHTLLVLIKIVLSKMMK